MASREQLSQWALKKFGQGTLEQLAPTLPELEKLYEYDHAHPGLTGAGLAANLAAERTQTEGGNRVPPPTAQGVGGQDSVLTGPDVGAFQHPGAGILSDARGATPTAATATTPTSSSPSTAASKAVPTPGSFGAQAAAALKKSSSTGASAVLGTFNADTPVYVDAPGNPIQGRARQRLSPEDQLAGGTGDRGAGARAGGIESTNYHDVVAGIYKMDDSGLKALKQRLWAGGFYPPGTDKKILDSAIPDLLTRKAYEVAVQQAARLAEVGKQTTVDDVIASGNPDPSNATGAAATGPYTITNPADLKTALNSAAQERLGRDLTKEEIGNFASLYQGMESQSSQRYAAAGRNNQELAVVSPPSTGAAAQDYLDTHFAAQEQGYGAVRRQFEFYDMLGGLQ